MKVLEYGKMAVTDYCPHGFSTKTASGVPVICGFCDPEAYEKRVKETGRKYSRGGVYMKRIKAW